MGGENNAALDMRSAGVDAPGITFTFQDGHIIVQCSLCVFCAEPRTGCAYRYHFAGRNAFVAQCERSVFDLCSNVKVFTCDSTQKIAGCIFQVNDVLLFAVHGTASFFQAIVEPFIESERRAEISSSHAS